VHSSIFSSSVGYPESHWLKTWLLTGAIFLVALLGWEATLRSLGHRPTVVDDKALWASQRSQVYGDCAEGVIVLLGDCRMQFGMVPRVLQEQFPQHRIVDLAVEGTSPVATLRDLAADEDFRGIVVCGITARTLCTDIRDTQQPYVDFYHGKYTLNERLNRRVSTAVQRTFTVVHPQLRLDGVLRHVAKNRRLPSPYYVETHADRSRLGDYLSLDLEAHRTWVLERARFSCMKADVPSASLWLDGAMELESCVRAIQARGGRVIFLQFPASREYLEYDEWVFPKEEYWDAFAAGTSALCLHFQDVPELSSFDCLDNMHLDRRDAPRFTLAFAKVLGDCSVFTGPPCLTAGDHAVGTKMRCCCQHPIQRVLTRAECACYEKQDSSRSTRVHGMFLNP